MMPAPLRAPGRIAGSMEPRATATGSASRGERWDIWCVQLAAGCEPCFATAQRFLCADTDCVWRERCLGLRAEWMR